MLERGWRRSRRELGMAQIQLSLQDSGAEPLLIPAANGRANLIALHEGRVSKVLLLCARTLHQLRAFGLPGAQVGDREMMPDFREYRLI